MGAQGSGRRKDMVNMFGKAEISLEPSHAAPVYEDYGEHKVVRGKEFVVDSIVFTDGTRQTTSGASVGQGAGTVLVVPLAIASGGTGRTDATTALVVPLVIASGGTGRTDATTALVVPLVGASGGTGQTTAPLYVTIPLAGASGGTGQTAAPLYVTTPLAVASGGTGRTDATAALVVPLAAASGGTGQTTATAAFDALAPTTTTGDSILFSGSNNIRVPIGSADQVWTVKNSTATWAAAAGGGKLELIQYKTFSTGTSHTVVVTGTYDKVLLQWSVVNAAVESANVSLQISGASANTYAFTERATATTIATTTGAANIGLCNAMSNVIPASGYVWMDVVGKGTNQVHQGEGLSSSEDSTKLLLLGPCAWRGTAVTGMTLSTNGGTGVSGSMALYGVAIS